MNEEFKDTNNVHELECKLLNDPEYVDAWLKLQLEQSSKYFMDKVLQVEEYH